MMIATSSSARFLARAPVDDIDSIEGFLLELFGGHSRILLDGLIDHGPNLIQESCL